MAQSQSEQEEEVHWNFIKRQMNLMINNLFIMIFETLFCVGLTLYLYGLYFIFFFYFFFIYCLLKYITVDFLNLVLLPPKQEILALFHSHSHS